MNDLTFDNLNSRCVPTNGGWIDVRESCNYPRETMNTLVFDVYGNITVARFLAPTGYWWSTQTNSRINTTHWMPLPEPPKEVKQNGET